MDKDTNMEEEEEDEEEESLATQFPSVPVYYKSYGENGTLHPLALSLEPPKVPKGRYRCFGDVWDPNEKAKTLKEEGRDQLFEGEGASLNVSREMRRVLALLLEKYRVFLGSLSNMDDPHEKLKEASEEFETLYINLLYLVNQLRPAQARQVLIHRLESQIEQRRSVAAKLTETVESAALAVREAMANCASDANILAPQEPPPNPILDGQVIHNLFHLVTSLQKQHE